MSWAARRTAITSPACSYQLIRVHGEGCSSSSYVVGQLQCNPLAEILLHTTSSAGHGLDSGVLLLSVRISWIGLLNEVSILSMTPQLAVGTSPKLHLQNASSARTRVTRRTTKLPSACTTH